MAIVSSIAANTKLKTMNLHLQDKVFIVTGGSEGIGAAISQSLVNESANIVIATKAEDPTHQLAQELRDQGIQVLTLIGDLTDLSFCEQVINDTIDHFGRLDGIVNNAGVNDGVGLEQGSPEAFRASLARNLYFYYDLVYYALPHLKMTQGAIVNIASKVALTGQGGTSGYAAAKGGILGLTREWAVELLPYQIRVNAVLPAEVMTPLYQKWLSNFEDPAAQEQKIVAKIPLKNRMTKDSEIAAMVTFLLSSQSGHTTGQFLHVDGGYVHLDRALS